MNFIIEGVDRLGKDTLIQNLMNSLGYFTVLHKQSPQTTKYYIDLAAKFQLLISNPDLYLYQCESFISDMTTLKYAEKNQINIIMNRSWIGEAVYAKRYRGYDGNFIFDLEKFTGIDKLNETLLILLHTSSFDFIKDDGQSLDFNKKDEEQIDFIKAFKKSKVKHKLLLDVHDGTGSFISKNKLLDIVIQVYKELSSTKQNMYMSWTYDNDLITFKKCQDD